MNKRKSKVTGPALAAMMSPVDEPRYLDRDASLTGGHRLEFLTVQSTNDV